MYEVVQRIETKFSYYIRIYFAAPQKVTIETGYIPVGRDAVIFVHCPWGILVKVYEIMEKIEPNFVRINNEVCEQ